MTCSVLVKQLPLIFKHTAICVVIDEQEGVFQDMAYLVLNGVPHTSLDCQAEGCSWQRVGEEEVAVVCIQLEGGAEVGNHY